MIVLKKKRASQRKRKRCNFIWLTNFRQIVSLEYRTTFHTLYLWCFLTSIMTTKKAEHTTLTLYWVINSWHDFSNWCLLFGLSSLYIKVTVFWSLNLSSSFSTGSSPVHAWMLQPLLRRFSTIIAYIFTRSDCPSLILHYVHTTQYIHFSNPFFVYDYQSVVIPFYSNWFGTQ